MKVLVIDDWEEFERDLNIIEKGYKPEYLQEAIKKALLGYELNDVVRFEAEVAYNWKGVIANKDGQVKLANQTKPGDRLIVLVAKKET